MLVRIVSDMTYQVGVSPQVSCGRSERKWINKRPVPSGPLGSPGPFSGGFRLLSTVVAISSGKVYRILALARKRGSEDAPISKDICIA